MKELLGVFRLMVHQKRDIAWSIFFGVLAGVTAVGLFAASGYLISKAALLPPIQTLAVLIALQKISSLTRAVSRYAERYYSHRATFTILSDIRTSFYRRLEPLAPGIFGKYRSGDLLARIVGDVESLQNTFLRVLYPPIVLLLVFFCTIFFVSFFSWTIAGLLLLGLILTGFLIPGWFAYREQRFARSVRVRRGDLSTEVTELFQGYRDLKIYQQLDQKEQDLNAVAKRYVEEEKRNGLHAVSNLALNTMVTLIISWLVLGVGAYLVASGQLEGVFLALLVMTSLTVFENAAPMAILPGFFEDSRHAAKRLDEVVTEQEEPIYDTFVLDQAPSFETNALTFTFPDAPRPVLRDVTVSIPAGKKTAIVGASGSGKSTLLQLMLRMYPTDGLTIAGQESRTVDPEGLWQHANVVLQQNHYFYGTLRDNLLLANEAATDEAMRQALDDVGLTTFELNDRVFEKGENLSGGEKQRLAIARVLLREASLYLLDEPTSSVDALTEQMILDRLFARAADATLVLVSHRLAGLEAMDQIIVMDQGQVIEVGTYAELMARQGAFYELKQVEQSVFAPIG
ncbi:MULTISPECIES: thiol reductant ABC exporter subunit CydC [Exiguobacterium]|uniref:ABC transporter ATP-binding protein n=1 Tax=Exiguobacterium indicum TaxID=296995 RepID=A0AAW3MDP7_9BACL|nr:MULTISPECIES: thiol reductant ABC exporter subunit CydC [Exiguobacterium]KTR27381.1 ABC transporter ATP-binding protein [Exiguobacterium indicum]MCQ4091258.1 thiol reductant ABC exporter subunit CydC [Exiguobacterium sp. LL15]NTY08143.1 thiol reductant ABC exporter subunit CydC [Exiguobacterium sp. JMULE1]